VRRVARICVKVERRIHRIRIADLPSPISSCRRLEDNSPSPGGIPAGIRLLPYGIHIGLAELGSELAGVGGIGILLSVGSDLLAAKSGQLGPGSASDPLVQIPVTAANTDWRSPTSCLPIGGNRREPDQA